MPRLGAIYFVSAPPSANHLHANVQAELKNGQMGTRRVKTQAYRNWIETAKLEMIVTFRGQRPLDLSGQHQPCLDLFCGFGYDRDCSNAIKPVEDLLKRCGIVKDDRYVHRASAERATEPLMHPDYGPLIPEKGKVLMLLTWHS